MKSSVVALVVASLLVAGSAFASEELTKKNNCMACHQLDAKAMGPSYKDIAAKYKDDADAVATLEKSIKEGSKDKWGGPMPMPAQAQAGDDAKAIAEWIMSLNDAAPAAE
ncbi:MAG: c-type cytochrome [Candidatus Electrothrix aestuarii]|uniref:C-type cytochrome n=1 Tax=Candidatus Electrothrix aestuarii TaxID=3062594 RepID=A0AAU8LS26_9BACT|nr:c-type cytochrome [Candidatus Electrothrix aestuarii]WPD21533.1 MAG: c-type cytochrome [Candidatus Electrothrix sp. GW3-3]